MATIVSVVALSTKVFPMIRASFSLRCFVNYYNICSDHLKYIKIENKLLEKLKKTGVLTMPI
jgi:hypothetical protein